MKVSASIELIWQLAGREVIAAKFKDIEPEHFFEALLKFSELPVEDVDRIARGANAAQELAAEVNTVRQELAACSINTTRIRRKLRGALGKGNTSYDGGSLHRSQASRDLFDTVARLAADAGSDVLTARYLLDALLASPTPLMKQVFGPSVKSASAPSQTPLLDKHGWDVKKMLAECKESIRMPYAGHPLCKALVQTLTQTSYKCVLFISEKSCDLHDIANSLVFEAGMKNKRIIDLTKINLTDEKKLEFLDKLLVEAANAKNIILFVPPIDKPNSEWSKLLQTRLSDNSLQCLCQVTPTTYNNWFKKNRTWKKIAQAMWIHDKEKDDVPMEL